MLLLRFLSEQQVPEKLEALAKKGSLLVIFSKQVPLYFTRDPFFAVRLDWLVQPELVHFEFVQRGVGNGTLPEHKLKEHVELVLARFAEVAPHVQLAAFFVTRGGTYQKPCVGMWEHLKSLLTVCLSYFYRKINIIC